MAQYRTPRYRQRTVSRPLTRWKCHWDPQRSEPRKFTARDAARIFCYAIRDGATRAQIDAMTFEICPGQDDRPRGNAAEIAAIAMRALAQSNETLLDSYRAFLVINGLLAALALILGLARFLGPLRLVAVPSRAAVTAAQTQIGTLMRINIVARAANDEAINALATLRSAA